MNSEFEQMKVIRKQISELHSKISERYKMMSKRGEEYYWIAIQKQIDSYLSEIAVLREQLKQVTHDFVNWDKSKKDGNDPSIADAPTVVEPS